jgi:hypothetical protein
VFGELLRELFNYLTMLASGSLGMTAALNPDLVEKVSTATT